MDVADFRFYFLLHGLRRQIQQTSLQWLQQRPSALLIPLHLVERLAAPNRSLTRP